MAEPIKSTRVIYHVADGAKEMYAIDAHTAVRSHPKEWSFEPWDGSEGPNLSNGELRAIVPNDWVDLPASQRIQLARQLGAKDVRSGAAADEFINGYLVERANAGVAPEPEPPAADTDAK